jgi:hypothetical protein
MMEKFPSGVRGFFLHLIALTILYKVLAKLTFSYLVTTSIYNHILGKLYCNHYGTMNIKGNQSYSCKLKFKKQSILDGNAYQVPIPSYPYFSSKYFLLRNAL